VIFGLSPAFAREILFPIEPGSDYEEISVWPGEKFTVRLVGRGWYINRFDRGNLRFLLREIGEKDSAFLMEMHGDSISYILFSTVDDDVYVRVLPAADDGVSGDQAGGGALDGGLDAEVEPDVDLTSSDTEAGNATGADVPASGTTSAMERDGESSPRDDSGTPEEEDTTSPDGAEAEPEPDGRASREYAPRDEGEIYYIDRNDNVVLVPREDENADFYRGIEHFESNRYEKAMADLASYMSGCETCTHLLDAHLAMAAIHEEQERYRNAVDHLERAADLAQPSPAPRRAEIHRRLGSLHRTLDEYEDAVRHLSRAYELNEQDVHVLKTVGDLHFLHDAHVEALSAYLECLERDLESGEVLFRVARLYDSPGATRNIEEAYRYYRELVERYPDSPYEPAARERIAFFEENFFDYR
jgi:TPR repeat protein